MATDLTRATDDRSYGTSPSGLRRKQCVCPAGIHGNRREARRAHAARPARKPGGRIRYPARRVWSASCAECRWPGFPTPSPGAARRSLSQRLDDVVAPLGCSAGWERISQSFAASGALQRPVRWYWWSSAPAGARTVVDAAQGGFAADVSCQWGARDCNPPVRALVSQFRRLRDHGDLLGFRMGPAPDVSMSKHWQGVQRLTANQGRFLAVSRSGKNVSFVVVAMASRDGSGERFRSNRIAARSAQRRPPARDRVVEVVRSTPASTIPAGSNRSASSSSWVSRRVRARASSSGISRTRGIRAGPACFRTPPGSRVRAQSRSQSCATSATY